MKRIREILSRRIEDYRDENEIYIKNEIATNVLMGKVVITLAIITTVHIVLTLTKDFTTLTLTNYITIGTILIFQIMILIANHKTKGHLLYARYGLIFGVIACSGYFLSMYGSEMSLAIVVPIIIAIKYYDSKFTKNAAIITVITAALASFVFYFQGDINLNIYYSEKPQILFDSNVPIVVLGVSKETYIYRLLIYEYLYVFLIIFIVSYIAYYLTKHGRKMIIEEGEIIKKTTRIDTELALASQIQANMLPCTYPAFPSHLDIDLFAANYPAKEMGGDFYDYFEIDDDHVVILIADVSGKGIGAAFFMSIAKAAMNYAFSQHKVTTGENMNIVNRYLCSNNKADLFVTSFVGVYEISTHKFTYSNAGHNTPVLIRKGQKPEFLKGKVNLVLAGMDSTKYSDNVIELNDGDEIILYTDGVTEANDKDNNLFGNDRLLQEIDKVRDLSCKEQVNSIYDSLKDYMKDAEQFDDITLLSMKIKD